MSGRALGTSIGPFNDGQSIFDFLDDNVLNQLAKALQAYKSFNVTAPLTIHRGPTGDTIGLQKRIDNFLLCELLEDLIEDTSATAKIVRRDTTDDFVDDSALEFEVWDSDIAVGGIPTKRYAGQRGIAFQNPFSKNANWEFLSLEIQQGGTIINTVGALISCTPSDPGFITFPFDSIFGQTPGIRFNLASNEVTVTGDGPLKLNYKIYVDRLGTGGASSDDSIEVKLQFDRGAGFVDIPCSFSIGLIDDVDNVCNPGRKTRYEGSAACPTFYFNAEDGDKIRCRVRRKAGSEDLNFPKSSDGFCSFMTFEHNR